MDSEMSSRDHAGVASTPKNFPRRRLRWRLVRATEARLGSLPMVLVTPTVAAVAGTAYAFSHPSLVIRKGLVVGEQHFWHTLWTGVAGGLVGLAAVIGCVFMGVWFWYRVLGGDRAWEAGYCGRDAKVMFFELRCKEDVAPADPLHLGAVECWVKTPSGTVVRNRNRAQLLGEPPGLMAFISAEPELGPYEVRWYAAREGERWREVARKRLRVRAGEPDSPWMSREAVA